MAESWRTEKKRPKIKVLPWPAIPAPTVDEVYAGVDEKRKEYSLWVESAVRQQFNADKPESLNGIRVLDMTTNQIIGHWCSSHFSELGADVIMVEPPGGDPLRKLTPFGREEYMFTSKDGEKCGARFLAEARNKFSVTLNVETEEGRKLLKKIIPQVDILIENAAPGHYDKLGIGYRQLSEINPRLVYLWVGQRGQWGPLKDQPGAMDPVAQCSMGFVHGTGAPVSFGGTPTRSGWWLCDQVGGTFAAIGAMAALYAREKFLGQGPVRRVHGGRGGHPDHRLQLGMERDGRLRPAPLRELGPRDQHLRRQPVRRRPDHGGRRARPALVPHLAGRREGEAVPRAAHLRGPEAPGRHRPASALPAGRDVHHPGRMDEGLHPVPVRDGAAGRGSRLGRRVVPRRGVRVPALQVPRSRAAAR